MDSKYPATQKLLVDTREAARILSLSPRTIWSLSASGQIPRVRCGRAVRFDIRDLHRWIDERKKGGPAG